MAPSERPSRPGLGPRSVAGLALVIVSTALWLGMFAVPFLPLSLGIAWLLVGALFLSGEVLFWLGVLLVGPDLVGWVWRWVPWRRRRLARPAGLTARAPPRSATRGPVS
jgi:hypothetical protein